MKKRSEQREQGGRKRLSDTHHKHAAICTSDARLLVNAMIVVSGNASVPAEKGIEDEDADYRG
jgi:hypothetical protein